MKKSSYFSLFFRVFLVFVLLVSFTAPISAGAAEGESNHFSLSIMHMNDTHAHVEQLPYMYTAVQEVRAQYPDALLLHAGDVFSGTLYFNQFHGKADLALMNLMGFDAMVYGNHEFDLGSSEDGHQSLAEFVEGANFPFVGTNIDFSGDAFMSTLASKEFTSPAEAGKSYDGIIKEINGEQVGIFGLTTEETADIASPVNVIFSDYIEAANRAVAAFEEQGVNKIIAVTHLGYNSNPQVGNDLLLAQHVEGIDVIVGGHSHTQLSAPVLIEQDSQGNEKDPTLIVQAYQYANYLGELHVDFDENGVVTSYTGQLIDTNEKEADAEALSILQPFKDKVDELANQDSGAVAKKTLANPRLGDSEVSVRANETELGNVITDAMLAKAQEQYPNAVIAMQNGGGIRAPIAEGPITVGEIIAVLPFGNDPVVVELTGEEIKEILEYSVRLAPAESGAFLHVAGMKFTYDSTKEPGSRIITMEVKQGEAYEEIVAEQTYLVTTNNFTAKGGDGFDVFATAYADGRVSDIGQIDWQQFLDYLVNPMYLNGVVDPVIEGRIIDLIGVEEEDETPDPDPEPEPNPDQTPIPDPDPSPDPTPNPDDQNGVDEDQDPINDGKTDDDTNEDGTRTDDDQGRQSGVGGTLPNTATNSYTILLVGGVLLLMGVTIIIVRKIRYKKLV
ncbi:bifunctional metallophosphatase/5'-nucleotidase [Alkalihalobacillus pseudalcaliphilus]|uniref:bifunctional metallophosphatase/5'-nucleotidase n=1 Tax=Alkalihalobacillus pseudalcaliphilus TaxID=79884 RepID=UPI00064E10BC|nr:5'-nucleotidase C-terminal domain-containing protein [Alkalihalobacillus pseudalcaliphilus]KMK78003.1 2', 3'-cyclic nucleotide 2'-phosphodiesterase [Alkalihalobacillus pseudalcaliphilus]